MNDAESVNCYCSSSLNDDIDLSILGLAFLINVFIKESYAVVL